MKLTGCLFRSCDYSYPFVVIIIGYIETGLPLMLGSLLAALIGLLLTHAWHKKLIDMGNFFGRFLILDSFMA
jgi:hypothetical protein